ncbi:MAG: lipopolysaccharide biosynthesis protein, partial [Cetobacterium sp.]
KFSLLNADQKNYMIVKRNLIYQLLLSIVKIIILYFYKNYIMFLLVEIFMLIIQNIDNSRVVDRIYPYIKTKDNYKIDLETKKNIIKNVKAMFLHNVGSYCVFGTDNLLISYFINVSTVGIYSNYSMLIFQVNNLAKPVFEGMGASIGNLIATESSEKNYSIFKISYMINFFINSILVICLFNLVETFIQWWLGNNLLLDKFTFIVLLINFYLTGMRASIGMFKSRAGIFHDDRFMPLLESIINLGSSIILVKYFGLAGIFMGTTLSTLSIVFWNVPRLVYKNIFKKSLYLYFKTYFLYAFLTVILCIITSEVIALMTLDNSFVSIVIKGLVSVVLPTIFYCLLFYSTLEFKYLVKILFKKLLIKNQDIKF